MALSGAKEHPILGYGQENFNIVFNEYFDPRLYSQETWFDRAHNIIFEWLIAAGILGLLSYLSLFGVAAWTLWKRHSDIVSPLQRNLLIGLLAGYLFQNIFVFDNLFSYIMFFMILAYIHHHSAEVDLPRWLDNIWSAMGKAVHFVSKSISNIAVGLVAILLVVGIYWINVKPIQANKTMLKSLYPRAVSQDKFDNMQKVFALNTFGSMEAREQLLFMLTEARTAQNIDQALFLKFLDLGAKEMQKQLEQSGNDARHQLFMGSFLHTFGRADVAVNYFENAVKLSPKKQIALFSLARAYIDLGRTEDALKVTKFAYELDTKYDRALVEYVTAVINAKQFDLADQLLATEQGKTQSSDPRIVDAYARNDRMDKVIAIWKQVILTNPKNQQAYFSLAASYYSNNQDSQAIKTLQNVKLAIPESKEQADFYIGEIRTGKLPR
jgi:tetratricopeptide (TPR) repeat protein